MEYGFIALLIIIVVAFIILLSFILKGIVVVRPYQVVIVERLGKYKGTLQPGLHFVNPIIDRVIRVDLTKVVGKEGRVVLVEGDKVVVRVEGKDWLAEGEGEFKVGDKVVVLEILGNKLRIKRR
jgi:regulator of protease activity HflC (stomatin/prohibitin superfamily)